MAPRRLAEVVLPEAVCAHAENRERPPTELSELTLSHERDGETGLPATQGAEDVVTVTVNADFAPSVQALIETLSAPERLAWLTTFLRRLNGQGPGPAAAASPDRLMTASQKEIVELCG